MALSSPEPRRPAGDRARDAALELLRQVDEDDAYANLALAAILAARRLTGRDAAFATELAYGTLRWQGLYDAVLDDAVRGDPARVTPSMRRVLRMGAHQLLSMRVPAHAAVSSCVALARGLGQGAAARAGFANAVLRAVAARDLPAWADHLGITGSDPASLAVRWSHPGWIVRAFGDALGPRRGELADLLRADNAPARPTLVARPGRMRPEDLWALDGIEPGRWSPLAGILAAGAPDALPVVRAGAAGVQDEGSQLVALALARAVVTSREGRWLDLCSGPGGKAAVLAGLAAVDGAGRAALVAVEPHQHRAALVRQALELAADADQDPGAPTVICADARTRPWGELQFDRVLVDAPCTGIGALRRRPEARWRRTPDDLITLGPLQRDLLRAGLSAVSIGGVLAYVTCSPHLAETQAVVSDVMAGAGDFSVEDARALLPEVPDCGDGPFVQLWPHRHGTDAMFLALIRRHAT
ncbi:MAG: RsmB/NOP family class I SAM-dependent RNA methyltransferase [Actinomycetales bacterium]|nr:RsmB/NOP family class I SAM-dependent RNA methyltransferase [Actinomycetales bacterium]